MSFAAPSALLAGVVVLVLLMVGLRRADRRRRADLARFASDHVLGDLTAGVSVVRRRVKRAMIVSGVALVLLALAGPEIGHRFEESRRRGIDVLIAVDVSKSMLAGDVVPNRLQRAKLAVADLVGQLGDRVGLIAFAGTAFLQCPLTLDHRAFDESLAVLAPDLIPQPGSNLASAIRVAEEALATEERNVKLLVLFSDGEDLGGDAVDAAKEAAEQKLRIFTVGVGTPAGELIPVPTEGGGTDFVKDAQGNIVKSRLDEQTLTEVAEVTGGFYVPLGARGEGVEAIRDRALAPIPKEELAARLRQVPQNRYQWPLLLGVVLLLVEPLISDRRRTSGAALAASLLVVLALPASAGATSLAEAKRLYESGKYAEARDAYETAHEADPENRDVDFNLGAAAYKAGDFADAAAAFSRALQSQEPARQQQSFYNLGNTQFRLGEDSRAKDPQQTMAAWQQAVEAFDQALALDAEDADAKFNRELVAKALEELKQEQEQQKQQQQQDGEQNDQQQDQQQQGQQDQQQQNDQQQNQQQQDQQQQSDQQQQGQQNQQDQQQQQQQDQPGQENQQAQQDQQQPSEGQGEQPKEDETPKPASGTEQQEQAAGEPDEAAVPGRMTPTEARALLESLRGEERTLPMLGQANQPPPPADGTVKDW